MAAHTEQNVRRWLTSNFNGSAASLTASVTGSLASVPEEREDYDFDRDDFEGCNGSVFDSDSDGEDWADEGGDMERVQYGSSSGASSQAASAVSSLLEVVRQDYDSGDELACDATKSCLANQLKEHDSLAVLIEMMKPFTEEAQLTAGHDEPNLGDSFDYNCSRGHTPVSAGASSRSNSRSPTRGDEQYVYARERRQHTKLGSFHDSPLGCADDFASAARRREALTKMTPRSHLLENPSQPTGNDADLFMIADLLSGAAQGDV
jgi:hypothetical protein